MAKRKLSKILTGIIAAAMIFQMAACGTDKVAPSESPTESSVAGETSTPVASDVKYTAGTYKSTQQGHNGFVDYEVTFSEDKITEINVVKSFETPGVSDKAVLTDLPANIISTQSLNVDSITGATISSMATLRAVEDCVTQAGVDPAMLKPEVATPAPEEIEKNADIIVVGGGGAGLAAAAAAAENGASVIVVEKVGYVGGNTVVSGGIYNAPDAEYQKNIEMTPGLASLIEQATSETPVNDEHAALIEEVKKQYEEYKTSGSTTLFDSAEWFALQTWNGGDKVADLNLVKLLTYNSYEALQWVKGMGYEHKPEVHLGAGSLYPRTHSSVKPLGTGFIDAYMTSLESAGIEVVYNTSVDELIFTDGKVTGAKGTDKKGNTYTFTSNKAVIISTGGFAGNLEMVQEYNTTGKWPDLSKAKTTNLPGIKGDGIKLATSVGGALRDMDQIQLLFICDPVTGTATRSTFQPKGAAGALFVNQEGNRFVREDGRRDEIALAIMEQTDGVMWMIQNADSGVSMDTSDLSGVPMKDMIEMGTVIYGETLEEACKNAGLPYETVKKNIDDYNKLVEENATKDEFNRALFSIKLENGPWFLVKRAPSVHHTMGGVVINEQCQVLDEAGNPIPGLYAAGEVVGGIHGGNRLGGNAIVDTVVFGRLAGAEASK